MPNENSDYLTQSDSELDADEMLNELDQISKGLNTKANNIIKSRKRPRHSKTTPPISQKRKSSARNVNLNATKSTVKEATAANDHSMAHEPWEQVMLEIKSMREDFQKTLKDLSSEVQMLKDAITQKDHTIKALKKHISARDDYILNLEERVDKLERDANDDTAIVSSPYFKSKTLIESVNIVSQATAIPMNDLKVDSYWRKFGENGDQLIVKFYQNGLKNDLFKAVRGNRTNELFISEFLSAKNNDIHYAARQHKKTHKNIHSVFTYKGQVYVRATKTSTPVFIKRVYDLEKFLPESPHSSTLSSPPAHLRPTVNFDPATPPPPLTNQSDHAKVSE